MATIKSGNTHTWSAVASGASGATKTLPFTSNLTLAIQVIPTGSASVAMEASLDGSTWTALTGLTAITAAAIYFVNGPVRYLRPTVTVSGTATVHLTWGDNK
jgi:hypothetical protein